VTYNKNVPISLQVVYYTYNRDSKGLMHSCISCDIKIWRTMSLVDTLVNATDLVS